MATLSELAKTQQRTSVGQAINIDTGGQQGTSIQATGVVDKSAALAGDIGKMFGGLVKEHQQASEYAGKRAGIDNFIEYNREMNSIEELYAGKENLSSADMVEKNIREQGIYEYYMQRGHFGDNDLANQSFKDTYARPATEHLFKTKTSNAKTRFKLSGDETESKWVEDTDVARINTTQDMLKDAKVNYKALGRDPLKAELQLADTLNLEINSKYTDNNPLYDVEAAGGDVFNEYYGNFLTMNKEGKVTKVDSSLSDKAADAMLDNYNALVKRSAKQKSNIMSTSAIPKAVSTTHTDGTESSTSMIQSKIDIDKEIRRKQSLVTDQSDQNKVDSLKIHQTDMGLKIKVTRNTERHVKDFINAMSIEGYESAWDNYLNGAGGYSVSDTVLGQSISQKMTREGATSFIVNSFNRNDIHLRNIDYDEILKTTGLNPYIGIAKAERSSGGKIQSQYMKSLSTDIIGGNLNGVNSVKQFKSEYNKFISYSSEKGTLDSTWLSEPSTRTEVQTIIDTVSRRIESEDISESEGLSIISNSFSGLSEMDKLESMSGAKFNSVLVKGVADFDADDAVEHGWTRISFGSESWAKNSKATMVKRLSGSKLENMSDVEASKEYIAKNSVPVTGGITGQLKLPIKDVIILDNGGRDLSGEKIAGAIMQRIQRDKIWGKTASDLTSSVLTMAQSYSKSGELITYVTLRSEFGDKPTRVYSFTLDEFEKGKVAYSKED